MTSLLMLTMQKVSLFYSFYQRQIEELVQIINLTSIVCFVRGKQKVLILLCVYIYRSISKEINGFIEA